MEGSKFMISHFEWQKPAKLASNLDAKVGLFTLADLRQHKKCAFSIFILLPSLHLKRQQSLMEWSS